MSYAWRVASTPSSILIFLPTSTPPVSSAWFQVRPQSSRSISVLAEKPMRAPPQGSVWAPSKLDVEDDGLGDVADGEVARHLPVVALDRLDGGAGEA